MCAVLDNTVLHMNNPDETKITFISSVSEDPFIDYICVWRSVHCRNKLLQRHIHVCLIVE